MSHQGRTTPDIGGITKKMLKRGTRSIASGATKTGNMMTTVNELWQSIGHQ